MYMKNRKKWTVMFFMTKTDQFLTVYSLYCSKLGTFKFFLYILYVSWDITNNIYLFLTVCDNSLMVWEEKLQFFLLLLRTKCHKVGLAIITVGPSDMDKQLVQLFLGPNERFWGGRTVSPLLGTFVTRTKCFSDPVSMDRNVRVQMSLGPKAGGLNIKAP